VSTVIVSAVAVCHHTPADIYLSTAGQRSSIFSFCFHCLQTSPAVATSILVNNTSTSFPDLTYVSLQRILYHNCKTLHTGFSLKLCGILTHDTANDVTLGQYVLYTTDHTAPFSIGNFGLKSHNIKGLNPISTDILKRHISE